MGAPLVFQGDGTLADFSPSSFSFSLHSRVPWCKKAPQQEKGRNAQEYREYGDGDDSECDPKGIVMINEVNDGSNEPRLGVLFFLFSDLLWVGRDR
jgi:hypothetical protein